MADGNKRKTETDLWRDLWRDFWRDFWVVNIQWGSIRTSRVYSQDVSSSDTRDFIVAAGLIISGLGLIFFPLAFEWYAPMAMLFGVALTIGGIAVLFDKEPKVDQTNHRSRDD